MIPQHFTSDDTILLEFPFNNKLAVLGVLRVDRLSGTYDLYGLNQMGLQFFHLAGDSHGAHIREAIPQLMDHKDYLLALANDIYRIYFKLVPDAISPVDMDSTHVLYTDSTGDAKISYEFGDIPTVLLEKEQLNFFGSDWRARYYQYHAGDGGKMFPKAIVMDDNEYHFRIIIKNRDWSIDE